MSFFLLVVFRLVIALSLPLLFIAMLYCALWSLQIYRTARRGRASGLAAEYVIGVTVCRLYYLLCMVSSALLLIYNADDSRRLPWVSKEHPRCRTKMYGDNSPSLVR